MRIAFLGVRVPGHLNPMTALARKLKARGHDVVFISVLDSEPYVRAAQLPFIPYCEKELPLGSVRQEAEQLSQATGSSRTRVHHSRGCQRIGGVLQEFASDAAGSSRGRIGA
jgi:UDP:flavonoid glycosyltransferase YjiC (YdhE family)